MRLPLVRWVGRGFAFIAASALLVVAAACGDDDSSSPTDAGIDTNIFNPPPPPPRDAAKPPEGLDTTGRLGTAQLVAEIGENIDGPSWSASEGVLYFTVPGNADALRKLSPDGGVTSAAFAGDAGPVYGTASGGTNRIFVSDGTGVTMLDLPDGGGAPTSTRHTGTFGLLGDIAADPKPDASVHAYVVDVTAGRAFRFDPNDTAKEFASIFNLSDGGARATAIAVGRIGSSTAIWVALSTDARGTVYAFEEDSTFPARTIDLQGIPPNGIALDEQGYLYVAWAGGINVYGLGGELTGSSPGLALPAAPTSLAFGGADRKTLYVTTAAGKIYAIPAKNPGVLR